jgi:hypothetical protein
VQDAVLEYDSHQKQDTKKEDEMTVAEKRTTLVCAGCGAKRVHEAGDEVPERLISCPKCPETGADPKPPRKKRTPSKFALLVVQTTVGPEIVGKEPCLSVVAEGPTVKACIEEALSSKVTGTVRAVCWHKIAGRYSRTLGEQKTFGFTD